MQLAAAMRRLLPVLAMATVAFTCSLTLASAGDTFGYDFRAYHAAAVRVLESGALYDLSYDVAGPAGLFLYPPTFLPLVLPLGWLPVSPATWVWTAAMLSCFAGAVALMPVSMRVRWIIVLLAGLSWPFVYNIKLGQVGPLLLLAFAAGWRGLERPTVIGTAGALGAAIKLQPGIVLAWAILTRRWRAALVGCMVLVILAGIATLLARPGAWTDFLALIARVNDPITTPHNFTPGAVAYQAGLARDTAALLQAISSLAVIVLVVGSALLLKPQPSYLIAVVASQLLSPVLWDHYAVMLLLPVAWLLERRHHWASLLVLATPIFGVNLLPPGIYPVMYWATLAALLAIGVADLRAAHWAEDATSPWAQRP